ncbi:hypothetical protein AVEN_132856-1 [Araneus ventricosus]|uniref:Uncharacterized protein n=1 Tax=Araneus ventricosus TaxID=182803 RepID=A0A4Y2GRL0_ARAVE|nr:hypothetical protein AVEN_132856-1 [Araneus ventricosus]
MPFTKHRLILYVIRDLKTKSDHLHTRAPGSKSVEQITTNQIRGIRKMPPPPRDPNTKTRATDPNLIDSIKAVLCTPLQFNHRHCKTMDSPPKEFFTT